MLKRSYVDDSQETEDYIYESTPRIHIRLAGDGLSYGNQHQVLR